MSDQEVLSPYWPGLGYIFQPSKLIRSTLLLDLNAQLAVHLESEGFAYLVGEVWPSPPGGVLALHEPGAVRGPALVIQPLAEGEGML